MNKKNTIKIAVLCALGIILGIICSITIIPNNSGDSSEYVMADAYGQLLLNDVAASPDTEIGNDVLLESTPEPTAEPTPIPTKEPTLAPTKEPTLSPAEESTAEPKESPSPDASESPDITDTTPLPEESPSPEAIKEPTATPSLVSDPTISPSEDPNSTPAPEETKEPLTPTPSPFWVNNKDSAVELTLMDMSLEDKIYQMMIVSLDQLTGTNDTTEIDRSIYNRMVKMPVGGVVFYNKNLINKEQTSLAILNLNENAKKAIGLTMFKCVDEEGGKISRVANVKEFGIDNIGPASNIKTAEEAQEAGETVGKYLSELGFSMDFAPDADVITDSRNNVIKDRSYGKDAITVSENAASFAAGLKKYNVLSTYKHFPGHGGTIGNNKQNLPYSNKTLEELMENELVPFRKAETNEIDAIMVAHICLPNVTGNDDPASMSQMLVTDVLRNELRYSGLIISDSLNTDQIKKYYTSELAAVRAIEAGCEMLLMPEDPELTCTVIKEAINTGRLSEEQIDNAVRHIISVKLKQKAAY